eukprot:14426989-Alexandrium_andersonii.AAC.1
MSPRWPSAHRHTLAALSLEASRRRARCPGWCQCSLVHAGASGGAGGLLGGSGQQRCCWAHGWTEWLG